MSMTQVMPPDRQVRNEAGANDRIVQLQLERQLRNRFCFASDAIGYDVFDGVAVLRGHVDSFHQKQIVQELARRTPGVMTIVNQLVVAPSAFKDSVDEVVLSDTNDAPQPRWQSMNSQNRPEYRP